VRIHRLSLEQFRNYSLLDLPFEAEGVNALVGPNGSGKTNILEAIGILSIGSSFRGIGDRDLVQWGKSHYRIRGALIRDDGTPQSLEVVFQHEPRRAKVAFVQDSKSALKDFVGVLPTVAFLPEDVLLLSGAPSVRRQFLDRTMIQVDPDLSETTMLFEKALRQRASLLRRLQEQGGDPRSLDPWDKELAPLAAKIIIARAELIAALSTTLHHEVERLGERWNRIEITLERTTESTDRESLTQELLAKLRELRPRDIAAGSTGVGPHRDDWTVRLDGRPTTVTASRGQERSVVLALFLLTASFVELRRMERPVILLDDACSELDAHHQKQLLSALDGYQVFLSSTHDVELSNGVRYCVSSGMVER
jgi:DNA replication and repair protein RecF